jgi:predicted amidohydrolase YtcJ
MAAADLAFVNGVVLVSDSPSEDATALAVANGRIVATGADEQIVPLCGPATTIVDLKGRSLLPGFTDCHCHLEMAAVGLSLLTDVHAPPHDDVPSMQDALRDACSRKTNGAWVTGQGNLFHDMRLREQRYPTRSELDSVSTRHKIAVRLGAHVTVLNSAALDHVLAYSKLDVRSDLVVKDREGHPTGICMDVWEVLGIPEATENEVREAIVNTGHNYFLARGVTAIGNVTETLTGVRLTTQAVLAGALPLRIGNYYRLPRTYSETAIGDLWNSLIADADELNWAAGVKLFADGGLSARLAATYRPHPGTTHRGHLFYRSEELAPFLAEMSERDIQVMIHCAGERAADMVIDAYRSEFDRSGQSERRWRIEHVGNPYATDARLKALHDAGILGVPNPTHLFSIGDHFASLVGEARAEHSSMRLRTMMDAGMPCPGNSDLTSSQPESSNPFVGIAAAVTRRTWGGKVINVGEAITVREALRMYTYDSAYAMHTETWRGSLHPGKVADLVVLERNVLTTPDDELSTIAVDETYVSGCRVFTRK